MPGRGPWAVLCKAEPRSPQGAVAAPSLQLLRPNPCVHSFSFIVVKYTRHKISHVGHCKCPAQGQEARSRDCVAISMAISRTFHLPKQRRPHETRTAPSPGPGHPPSTSCLCETLTPPGASLGGALSVAFSLRFPGSLSLASVSSL